MIFHEESMKKKKKAYPDCRGHVVGADFSKVSAHDAVVKSVKQHDHTDVHRVLCLDPAQRKERSAVS